jgi:dephospho-CoA kinase
VSPPRLLRVGLTGGIASGKSHVLRRLAETGFATVDLDRVGHALLAPGGAAHGPVVEAFGPGILDAGGAIDRKALGAIVFASPAARARLDALVHPLIRGEERRAARAAAEAGAGVLVTDAALLVETGLHLRFDRLVVTHCGSDLQLQRLRARDGLDEASARARLAAQMPPDEKRRYAHVVVDTSRSQQETDAQVAALAVRLRALPPPQARALPAGRAAACLRDGPAEGPRGLTPERVLDDAATAGGLDLARLALLLVPPAAGPWYRAARADEGAPGPETLAGPLVLWCAARGADADFVLGAAASLARLTHAADGAVAGACLAALALWDAAERGAIDLAALDDWSARARERAGAAPPPDVAGDLRRAAAGAPVPGTLSGALAGLVRGGEGPVPGPQADLVERTARAGDAGDA